MLDSSQVEEKTFEIPPKLRLAYTDFKFIQQTVSYRLYEAKSRNSDTIHTIRVLDPTTQFVSDNHDLAATLFIQELLRLHYVQPEAVLTNTFEISKNGQQIAYASLPYHPLNHQSDHQQQQHEQTLVPKDPDTIGNLIKGVISDIEFLWKDIQLKNVMNSLGFRKYLLHERQKSIFPGQLG